MLKLLPVSVNESRLTVSIRVLDCASLYWQCFQHLHAAALSAVERGLPLKKVFPKSGLNLAALNIFETVRRPARLFSRTPSSWEQPHVDACRNSGGHSFLYSS